VLCLSATRACHVSTRPAKANGCFKSLLRIGIVGDCGSWRSG
jgi:hypothetical protein